MHICERLQREVPVRAPAAVEAALGLLIVYIGNYTILHYNCTYSIMLYHYCNLL